MARQPRVEILASNSSLTASTLNGRLYLRDAPTRYDKVIGAAVAPLGNYIAILSLEKGGAVLTSTFSTGPVLELARHLLPKRLSSVSITHDLEWVIVSDGFGDVYKLPIDESVDLRQGDNEEACILGHFSSVTQVSVTPRFIFSGDRDARVRMSQLSHPYIVEAFGLGHTDAVTSLTGVGTGQHVWPRESGSGDDGEEIKSGGKKAVVMSGSADGTLRLWALDGTCLSWIRVTDNAVVGKYRAKNYGSTMVDRHPSLPSGCRDEDRDKEGGEGWLVPWVAEHPRNKDVGLFGVYGARAVFMVRGVSRGLLGDIEVVGECEDVVCGIAVDATYNRIWVSVQGSRRLLWWSLCDKGEEGGDGDGGGEMGERKKEKGVLEIGAEEGRAWERFADVDFCRFEWLVRQRKRNMVEDWKGKKRRHLEIEDEIVDGNEKRRTGVAQ